MSTAAAELPLLFDHYLVERVLGTGAMGVVYLARDQRIGRPVALKTLHGRGQKFENEEEEHEFVQRFRREAQLCGSLIHPNIVTLFEIGQEGPRFTYLAMEYVEGESLLSLMRRKQQLPVEMACKIIDDVLLALSHAHDRGIIHRDIKPANILVSTTGQAKISDFGIARTARGTMTELTQSGRLLGTPHYMSPEQVAGKEIDTRSDLFSAGVVLYEMLCGRKPFDGAGLTDVLYKVVNEEASSLAELNRALPDWVVTFTERLLTKSADARFPSGAAASRELHRLLRVHAALFDLPQIDISLIRDTSPEETPTTPILATMVPRRRFSLYRQVSRSVALLTVAAVCATAGVIYRISTQIDDTPRAVIHPEQIAEYKEKRVALDEAALLLQSGALEESVRRYRELNRKYPDNLPAREGLLDAERALSESRRLKESADERFASSRRRSGSRGEVNSVADKDDEKPVRNSWWRRVWNRISN